MSVQIDGSTGNIIAIKADYSGDVSIGGTLTYEDVTNVDSVGIITARSGVNVTGGSVGIGTDSPVSGVKLHLQDTSACRIQLSTDNTGHTSSDGTRLMIDSSNNFEILNKENTNIEFFTNNFERVRITGIGSVGIATATPFQSILHVCDSTSYQGIFINGSGAPRINFARAATTTVEWGVGIDGTNGNRFAIAQAGNTAKLVIDTGGNVNITGITTATQLFEGTTRVATSGKAIAMALIFG